MPRERKKYNVFIVREPEGVYGNEKTYSFVGDTFAVSEAQAINNVRYRTGSKSTLEIVGDYLEEGTVLYYYEAKEV